jgi:hypothetical protein
VTILNSAVCFIAAPTAAVTAVSWLLTFTPWARFMSDVYFVPLFFLTFPLFGWSVFVLSVVRRPPGSRRQPADPLKEIPQARVPLALAGAKPISGRLYPVAAVRMTWLTSGARAPCARVLGFRCGTGRHQPSAALAAARLSRETKVSG